HSFPTRRSSDLQNFVSQIVKRGGFGMSGDGDGCRSENTYSEWYMIPNPDPTIFCLGDGRYFEWSTGWTVVDHFKWYFTYNNSYAQNLGWTSSYSTADRKSTRLNSSHVKISYA